jgi:hypothetical protein
MCKIDVEIYYNLVIKNRIDLLSEIHASLPQTILELALENHEFDVSRILLDHGYIPNFKPMFKTRIIKFDNSIGFKHINDESDDDINLKFEIIKLLMSYNIVDDTIIPNCLKTKWIEFKNK